MIWEIGDRRFESCNVIYKVDGEYGDLSNMSNAHPLTVNGVIVKSSEALYQVCKYPSHPDWQQDILDAPHAMQCKMKAGKAGRPKEIRTDWLQVNVSIMRWVLRVKLACHPQRMAALLRWSGQAPFVELSRKDAFWGAVEEKEGVLKGENHLGRLLTELRENVRTKFAEGKEAELLKVEPLAIPDFNLLGHPITELAGTGSFGSPKPHREPKPAPAADSQSGK
ncbi:NADAR family protein [Zavarzinella formosa]|uniref:NADAR family protein n=1 Tax=Zavarzinella formosa TaxID=360055 RepID=UPI0002F3017A|nr:NADAR family protein [Zavarzinella formosa]